MFFVVFWYLAASQIINICMSKVSFIVTNKLANWNNILRSQIYYHWPSVLHECDHPKLQNSPQYMIKEMHHFEFPVGIVNFHITRTSLVSVLVDIVFMMNYNKA